MITAKRKWPNRSQAIGKFVGGGREDAVDRGKKVDGNLTADLNLEFSYSSLQLLLV